MGSINQSKSCLAHLLGVHHGSSPWEFTMGVHRGRLPLGVHHGSLGVGVHHGKCWSSSWKFTAAVYCGSLPQEAEVHRYCRSLQRVHSGRCTAEVYHESAGVHHRRLLAGRGHLTHNNELLWWGALTNQEFTCGSSPWEVTAGDHRSSLPWKFTRLLQEFTMGVYCGSSPWKVHRGRFNIKPDMPINVYHTVLP